MTYLVAMTFLALFISHPALASRYEKCPEKPYLAEIMTWSFKINILGTDDQGRYLISLAPDQEHIVDGKVKGKLTKLNIVNQVDRDLQGDEVERIISWNGIIRGDDGVDIKYFGHGTIFLKAETAEANWGGQLPIIHHWQFYSAHSLRFETNSEKYKYLNNLTVIGREVYANFIEGEEIANVKFYAILECFDGIAEQLELK